jgi:hypothetical protein
MQLIALNVGLAAGFTSRGAYLAGVVVRQDPARTCGDAAAVVAEQGADPGDVAR